MGKVILTEKQYKNLNQSLISETLNIEKNKTSRVINEMTEDEKLNAEAAGKKIQAIYKKCNTSYASATCVNDMNNQLKVLKTKEQFDYAAKFTSYWFANNWPASLGNFLKKLMSSGNLEDLKVKPFDVAKTFAAYFKVAGGTLGIKRIVDAEGNQTIDPMGLTLSWAKVVTPEDKKALTKLGTDYIIKNFSACIKKFPQVMPDKTGLAQYQFPNNWVWQSKNANGQVYFVVGDSNWKFIRNLKDCNDEIFKTAPTNQTVVTQQTTKKQRNTVPGGGGGGGSELASLDW